MTSEQSVKVLVVGPKKSGKSSVCNFLSGYKEFSNEYRPTMGLRICECEREMPSMEKVSVELWDVSGDRNFENCWPAILKDVSACLIVYNPSNINHVKELEFWYKTFVQGSKLKDENCCIFAHCMSSEDLTKENPIPKLPKTMSKIPAILTNLDIPDKEKIFGSFDRLVQNCVKEQKENEEKMVLEQ
ncbi:hypothetical protein C9374_005818 [Naegleria lovaniensis]|uniref:Rab family small GTPase n=1 Tax=Naegleria lovaniensis TaxID=51637 RepID=A0AA88KN03_NAELO|nr:uncharacterized protein C9374_005818 [Naegleria lovaniensis]KAG2382026.1 hypothetical protein C9374_005818 [Naegleria lovaniensis]